MGRASGYYNTVVKRIIDLGVSSALIVVTAPVLAASAIAVKTNDGGPILFKQKRLGRFGEPFTLYKLRTMSVGTEEQYGGYPIESAVTTPGKFLRRTSLDELPQLWNILKGEMSIVGPRPVLLSHLERYTADQRIRLLVRPGVTGLAQVKYRNNATWSMRIKEDVKYVQTVSLWTDLIIMARTVRVVLLGENQSVGQVRSEVDDLGTRHQE